MPLWAAGAAAGASAATLWHTPVRPGPPPPPPWREPRHSRALTLVNAQLWGYGAALIGVAAIVGILVLVALVAPSPGAGAAGGCGGG